MNAQPPAPQNTPLPRPSPSDESPAQTLPAGADIVSQPLPPPATPSTQAPINSLPLVPDYELLRRIGAGAYGEVWLARSATGVMRAVKIVYRATFTDERPFNREFEGIKKFEQISRLQPSQLALFHVGRNDAAGCFYSVMELADPAKPPVVSNQCSVISKSVTDVTGASLNTDRLITDYCPRTLRHDLEQHGRLAIPDCVQIGLSLTTALARLHQHGLVHRDIKPSNVIFVNGVPKLGDIGLVTEAGDTQSIVGTEGYLPPEGPGTPQADIFSLGKVLYEISTGMDRRRFAELPEDLRSWPDRRAVVEFNEILLRACAKDPARRYYSADEMQRDLARLQRGRSLRRRRAWEQTAHWTKHLAPVAATVSIAAALLWPRLHDSTIQRSNATTRATLFVLPFRNDGTNQVDELLRSRITDGLIDSLGSIPSVQVGRRQSALLHWPEDEARQKVRSDLRVSHMLSGTTQVLGGRLRVTTRLQKGPTNAVIWSESREAQTNDLANLGQQITESAAKALYITLTDATRLVIGLKWSNNMVALQFYQQTSGAEASSKTDFESAIGTLNRALALDPNFVEAHIRVAFMYRLLSDVHMSPKLACSQMRASLLNALAIDDSSASAHSSLAGVQMIHDWDWAGTERSFRRSIELSGGDGGGNYACFLESLGRWEEALGIWRKQEELYHDAVGVRVGLYNHFFLRHRYDDALTVALRGSELFPKDSQWPAWLGRCHAQLGDREKGLELIRNARALDDSPLLMGLEGNLLAVMGRLDDARRLLEQLRELGRTRYVAAPFRAFIQTGLGELDAAFTSLNQAYEDRSETLVFSQSWPLKYDPIWDPLRSDPRYTNLLRKLNLEP